MATVNRADRINKTYKVLKKHYTPFAPNPQRSLLEQLLYACCLENSLPAAADAVMQRIQSDFYDLNEIRVTTVRELAEIFKPLSDPEAAATRLKGVLQGVFESLFSFDIEAMRKQNLGQAIKTIEKFDGATPFVVAYATQTALGGHSIPVNAGAMNCLVILGVLTESEAEKGRVPGLERTISKAKGIEFGALLHQLGVALAATPFATAVRNILLEIAPDAKERLPKRASKAEKKTQPVPAAQKEKSKAVAKPAKKADAGSAAKKTSKKQAPAKTAKAKTKASPRKAEPKKAAKKSAAPAGKKPPGKSSSAKNKAAKKSSAKKSPAKAKPAKMDVSKKGSGASKGKTSAAKSTSKGITKRKPK